MKDSTIISFICFFFAALGVYVDATTQLPIVKCNEPVLATVEVDPQHRFQPYYVRLHRCEGSWKGVNPKIKKCVATTLKEIEIKVFSLERKKFEVHHIYNHTSCGAECTTGSPDNCDLGVERWNEKTCECDCLFKDAPPPERVMKRKKGFRWNKHICNYQCHRSPDSCSRKKEFDSEACSCVCNGYHKRTCEHKKGHLNPDTCECLESHAFHGMSQSSFTVVVTVLAVFLVVIVLFALILCHRRRRQQVNLQQPQTPDMTPETSSVAMTDPESDRASDSQISEGQVKSYRYESNV